MKYMMLIYMEDQALNEAEREHCYVESTELAHQLKSNGQYLGLPRCSLPPPPPASGCATASAW